ncbi:hypothetical protein PGTUg99_003131 [Puccinia graminis f. sp. tritici]|uniref:Uncharacterized protein n=1 Tax=Puccinia graminis f. sp. tritici TaxID=56615 RepID=A0A5B0QGZ4_PUCGR|nr:hypothetical protein PGTUg99_003131 [Puccinia graminis f. sp. tritici]
MSRTSNLEPFRTPQEPLRPPRRSFFGVFRRIVWFFRLIVVGSSQDPRNTPRTLGTPSDHSDQASERSETPQNPSTTPDRRRTTRIDSDRRRTTQGDPPRPRQLPKAPVASRSPPEAPAAQRSAPGRPSATLEPQRTPSAP